MDYNFSDSPIRLREYGRNIQKMAEYLETIEDFDKRTQLAHEIVRFMGIVAPNTNDMADFKKKLWDHFYQIGQLNYVVNSPFPPPEHLLNATPPQKVEYYKHKSKFKQYGKNVELMIAKALQMPEGEERTKFILEIAALMKLFLQNYVNNQTNDDVVFEHLAEMSNGRIRLNSAENVIVAPTANTKHPASSAYQVEKKKKRVKFQTTYNPSPSSNAANVGNANNANSADGRQNKRKRGGKKNKNKRPGPKLNF